MQRRGRGGPDGMGRGIGMGPGRGFDRGRGGPDGPGGFGRPGHGPGGPPDESDMGPLGDRGRGFAGGGLGVGPGGGPDDHGPMGGPGGGGSATDLALLQAVLSFYDRFASQNRNETGPTLQTEVALAHRKVGALYLRLDRFEEAEAAIGKAAEIFERLLARLPDDRDARLRLVQTDAMIDPGSAPDASLERVEKRLTRARALADRLVEESPATFAYGHDREKILYKLGLVAERLGQDDRAEATYREAIAAADALLARWPDEGRAALDRLIIRDALIGLQIARGRTEEARKALDEMAGELRANPPSRAPAGPILDRVDGLAALYEKLGDAAKAREMSAWADELKATGRDGGPDDLGPRHRGGPDPGRR